jgi:hypothetical protein
MLIETHHVLLFANEELDVFIAKMLKNQNSIRRWIVWSVHRFSKFVLHAINDDVHLRDDLNDCFTLQTFYDVFVAVLDYHVQILREDSHHRWQFFFLTRKVKLESQQREDDFRQISMHVIDFSQHALKIKDFWLSMKLEDQALQTIKNLQDTCLEHDFLSSL